jgi:hypothetical protein
VPVSVGEPGEDEPELVVDALLGYSQSGPPRGATAELIEWTAGRRVLVLDGAGRVAREILLPAAGSFTDIAVGSGGKLYAIDAASAALWVADEHGKAFRAVAPSLGGRAKFPAHITADRRGLLFVADQHGHRIVVLGEDGSFRGRGSSMGRGDGLLYYPAQICVAGDHAFVADRNNDRVQVFSVLR